MTLSSPESRRTAKKQRLREYDDELRARKPWLFPTLVIAAVAVLVAVVVVTLVTGIAPR